MIEPRTWILWLFTAAAIEQALEHWIDAAWIERVWPWTVVRSDVKRWPRFVRFVLDGLASDVYRLNAAIFGAAVLGLWIPGLQPITLMVVWLGLAVMSLRFRGALGGGSDSLMFHGLGALVLSAWIPSLALVCVTYIAVTCVVSYVLAGLSKLAEPTWRDGTALRGLMQELAPQHIADRFASPLTSRLASRAVIAWECLFGGALVSWPWAVAWAGMGILFHLANARWWGLRRFVLPWLATYPALLWVAYHGS